MRDTNKPKRDQTFRQAGGMRDRVMALAAKRKEEYLGARVPRELKEKVILRAKSQGIPVSILIRRVLEETFGGESFASAGNFAGPADTGTAASAGATADRFSSVLGWEEISLNRAVICSGCGRHLKKGLSVTLGIAAAGEKHVILCDLCKESI